MQEYGRIAAASVNAVVRRKPRSGRLALVLRGLWQTVLVEARVCRRVTCATTDWLNFRLLPHVCYVSWVYLTFCYGVGMSGKGRHAHGTN